MPTTLDKQLEQVEAYAQLLAAQIRTIRTSLHEEPAAPAEEDGICLHPVEFRQPAGAMGNPGRFLCARCRQFGGLTPKA